jgi:hypothetical protein
MTGPVLEVEDLVKHFDVKRSWLGKPLTTVKAVDGVSPASPAAASQRSGASSCA